MFRTLGYKVADYVETCEFLSEIWLDYLEGRCSIHRVIEKYKKYGFQGYFLFNTHVSLSFPSKSRLPRQHVLGRALPCFSERKSHHHDSRQCRSLAQKPVQFHAPRISTTGKSWLLALSTVHELWMDKPKDEKYTKNFPGSRFSVKHFIKMNEDCFERKVFPDK